MFRYYNEVSFKAFGKEMIGFALNNYSFNNRVVKDTEVVVEKGLGLFLVNKSDVEELTWCK